MPRHRKSNILADVRANAHRVLKQLEDHIRALDSELRELVSHADAWRGMVGKKRRQSTVARTALRKRSPRVDWSEVLSSLPPRFGIDDVLKHSGAAAKGRAQIYPAFSRWEAAKQIRRVATGVYEKSATRTGGAVSKRGPKVGEKRGARKAKSSKAA